MYSDYSDRIRDGRYTATKRDWQCKRYKKACIKKSYTGWNLILRNTTVSNGFAYPKLKLHSL